MFNGQVFRRIFSVTLLSTVGTKKPRQSHSFQFTPLKTDLENTMLLFLQGETSSIADGRAEREAARALPISANEVRKDENKTPNQEAYGEAGERLFFRYYSDRTRSHGYTLKERESRLDFRKKFFTVKLVSH